MKTRVITGTVFILLLIPVLIFSNTYIFNAVIALLSVVAAYELLGCFGMARQWSIALPTYLISASFPILCRLISTNRLQMRWTALISLSFLMYLLFASVVTKGKFTTEKVALVFMSTCYVAFAFTSVVMIRDLPEYGEYVYLLIFLGAFITDTFAYFTGKFFGRHKLIPEVSPNKTVEGSLGGVLFCSLSFVLYGVVLNKLYGFHPNLMVLAVAGVILSVVGQMGDLIASSIKRNFGVKDFGKLFPGHGGVLDRFDSIMSIAPFLLLIYLFMDSSTKIMMFR